MTPLDSATWQFAAFGKHPAARDYFRLGDSGSALDPLFTWVEGGYGAISATGVPPEFRSWRFWSRGKGKDSLICGVVRLSSDSLGRPYPFVIAGAGRPSGWEERWDLLPLACEKSWAQMEYLAANLFDDLKKLEEEIRSIREPEAVWDEHLRRRRELSETGSLLDPYAGFLDLPALRKKATEGATAAELLVGLDRGPCHDKILQVSLWHHLLKEAHGDPPLTACLGGTLERSWLATLRRPLSRDDFGRLWGASSALPWKVAIGTENSMDLSALGRDPVRPDRPAGTDVRYDPAFDELQAELDKLSTPSAAGVVNWEKVVRFSADILAGKSKDLLVASWLSVALIHTRGLEGFGIGVRVYLDLLERFWDDMYPSKERMRGRVRSVEWWLEKGEAALLALPARTYEARQVAVISESLQRIDRILAERLEDAPPLMPLKRLVESLSVEEITAAPAASEQRVVEPASAPQTPAPFSAPSQQVQPLNLDGDPLQDGTRMLREAAFRLWQQDLANPLAYRLCRQAAWLTLMDLPPATDGRTRIPAPDLPVRRLLFDLRDNGDAEALVKAAEIRVPEFVFWLDLHRLVAEALSRLGGKYAQAAEEVGREACAFIRRLPGVEDLAFADGTPFADPETREWLQQHEPGTATEAPSPESGDTAAAAIATAADEARRLIRKGDIVEGVATFSAGMREAASGAARLQWRTALTRTLIAGKQHRHAMPYLNLLLEDVERYRLEDFDPRLAIDILKLAWQGFDAAGGDEGRKRGGEVLARIARLDAVEAVRLGKG